MSRAAAEFENIRLGTALTQIVQVYEAGDGLRAMEVIRSRISSCSTWTDRSSDGTIATWTIRSLPFSNLGDETIATRLTASSGGVQINADWIVVRAGDAISLVMHVGLEDPDSAVSETISRRVAAKLGR